MKSNRFHYLRSEAYYADPFGVPSATKGLAPVLSDPLNVDGPAF